MIGKVLAVAAGGALGAVSRYLLSELAAKAHDTEYPLGTFLVNVLGCFVLGGLMVVVQERDVFSPEARVFLTVGILGSLTTFSTFGHETLSLVERGRLGFAVAHVLANVVVGLIAVVAGRAIVRSFL